MITIDPELLAILVCPKCKGPLERRDEPPALVCGTDRLAFEVRDGIPIMLIEDAQVLRD